MVFQLLLTSQVSSSRVPVALESIASNLSSHITNPVVITIAQKDGTSKTKVPMMVKRMSAKLEQQRQLRMEVPFNMAFYVATKGLAFKKI